jgi:hypothetical protein
MAVRLQGNLAATFCGRGGECAPQSPHEWRRKSVYLTIGQLISAGVLRKMDAGGRSSAYELAE